MIPAQRILAFFSPLATTLPGFVGSTRRRVTLFEATGFVRRHAHLGVRGLLGGKLGHGIESLGHGDT